MYQNFKLIALFVFISLSSFGQDLKADFTIISQALDSANSVSMKVVAKTYSSNGGKLLSSTNASIDVSGKKNKNVLGELEFINTEKYFIRIDHEEKAILILKLEKTKKKQKTKSMEIDVEALKKFLEPSTEKKPTIKLVSNYNGAKSYAITGIDGMVEMKIDLNVTTKSISKISYEYGASGGSRFVLVEYQKFEYDHIDKNTFDLTRYFTIDNNSYKLSELLKGYKIYTEE